MVKQDQQFYIGQKAFIEKDNKILILIDPLVGWDFPGGKIQEGELDFSQALKREVKEETNLDIKVGLPFCTGFFEFPVISTHRNSGKKIYLVYFICQYTTGKIALSPEHSSYKWINKRTYKHLDIAGSNLAALNKYSLISKDHSFT